MKDRILAIDGSIKEDVVLRAMHWSDLTAQLTKTEGGDWNLICIEPLTARKKTLFYKALTDFRLRSLIDNSTYDLRTEIIRQALSNVYNAK